MEVQAHIVDFDVSRSRRGSGVRAGPDGFDVVVGRRLRRLRQSRKLSLDALASAIGVSFQQIQKYEHGANRMSISMLIRIAQALDVSVHDFLDVDVEATRAFKEAIAFLNEDDAVELVRAFARVPEGRRRRSLLQMVSLLAED